MEILIWFFLIDENNIIRILIRGDEDFYYFVIGFE